MLQVRNHIGYAAGYYDPWVSLPRRKHPCCWTCARQNQRRVGVECGEPWEQVFNQKIRGMLIWRIVKRAGKEQYRPSFSLQLPRTRTNRAITGWIGCIGYHMNRDVRRTDFQESTTVFGTACPDLVDAARNLSFQRADPLREQTALKFGWAERFAILQLVGHVGLDIVSVEHNARAMVTSNLQVPMHP